jgi:hypothetical protein
MNPNPPVAPQFYGGNGGPGVTTSINGAATGFAGGGGGSGYDGPGCRGNNYGWPNGSSSSPGTPACVTAGYGGALGGKWTSPTTATGADNGSINKGGGGGGSGGQPSGGGGSGIVIIRYKYQ